MCIRDRCQGVKQGSCGGEPCRGGCGVVSVLGQQRRDFAYDVAGGASADLEQIGEGVLGAAAALVEDGAQHAFGVGDLLSEHAAAGSGQAFPAAAAVAVSFGADL